MSNPEIDTLLSYDPLLAAEKLTGTHATRNCNNPASMLGVAFAMAHSAEKRRVLLEAGDTVLCNDLSRYRGIIEDIGFREVLADPWTSTHGYEETLFLFAHRDGLLLCFDTFNTNGVNSAQIYYNWKPNDPDADNWKATSSGHWTEDGVHIGRRDAREALLHKLTTMTEYGSFMNPWVEQPFLWLLNYDDVRVPGYDYRSINEGRLRRLPQWVLDFVSPEPSPSLTSDRSLPALA